MTPQADGGPRSTLLTEEPARRAVEPVRVTLTAAHLESMPRSVPTLVGRVRRALASRGAPADDVAGAVIVDLAELPVLGAAACVQVLLLVRLLHDHADRMEVVVAGVPSTARDCLAGGLPDGVRLVDRRGRSWPH